MATLSFRYFLWTVLLFTITLIWFCHRYICQAVCVVWVFCTPPTPLHIYLCAASILQLLFLNLMFHFGSPWLILLYENGLHVTSFTRVKYGSQLFSNTLIMFFNFFISFLFCSILFAPFLFPPICVMSVCTKCRCWSYVFSALGFFSYCLPALFGSSSSQPVCYFLSLLRVYICVSLLHHRTNRETLCLACTSNFFYVTCAVWVFLNLLCANCVHLFMVFCALPASLWFWIIFFPVSFTL